MNDACSQLLLRLSAPLEFNLSTWNPLEYFAHVLLNKSTRLAQGGKGLLKPQRDKQLK